MNRMSRFILEEPSLFFAWLLLVSASAATIGVWIFTHHIGIDFGVFWRTAHEPASLVYTPHARYPFPYPPSALLFVAPLVWIPKWLGFVLWSLLSAFALWRVLRHRMEFWPVVLVMLSPPVTNGLGTGQTSMLLAAATLWGLQTDRRILAGALFGIAAMIKPQLLLFLPLLLLLRRDWHAIVASFLVAASVLAVTTGVYGADIWRDWLGALPRFRETLYDLKIDGAVITLPGFADRMGLSMVPFILIGLAFGAFLVWRSANKDFIEAGAAVAIASFFVAPYALGYDLILAAPYLVRQIFRRDILPTIALAIAPNPLPVILGAASLLGAKVDLALLTAGVRRPATD